MTAQDVLDELEKLGTPGIKKTWLRHGAKEPVFGVKIGDMQPLRKKLNGDHPLALAVFDTGVADAMYFAGLICEPKRMTKADLNRWLKAADWGMIAEYTVPWVAAESNHGRDVAIKWIDAKDERTASAGWNTLSSLVGITPDEELDLKEISALLDRVQKSVAAAPNRVKYTMNGFVIAVGSSVAPLSAKAKAVAEAIGKVEVDMGDTECKVPYAPDSIAKVEKMGRVGRKKKMARC
jgi:3-methyladenine DNA glycosylase AlkD